VSDAYGQKFYCRDCPLVVVVVAAAENLQRWRGWSHIIHAVV
jgi:hypothetical protein